MADKLEFTGKPVAKPRMTRADAWKKRPVVEAYWKFKDSISAQAEKQNFKLGMAYKVTFVVALPKSMSKKQKSLRYGRPHTIRPDLDNMLKSLNDCLMDEDSSVHYIVANKIWGDKGKIIVRNYTDDLEFS